MVFFQVSLDLSAQSVGELPDPFEEHLPRNWKEGRLLKGTSSICPHCLEKIDAEVFEREGAVWMDKSCAQHGSFSALLAADARHYFKPGSRSAKQSCCGSNCAMPATGPNPNADQAAWANHSCTILIEITERCNLSCPTCFAGSSPLHSSMMSLEKFTRQVDQLLEGGKSSSDMIQLSGGEPTIHPQFIEMIDVLFERGFHQVCINSNGIKLARGDFTRQLAACMDRHPGGQLFAYLQFDGFEPRTLETLRGRSDLLDIKRAALNNCETLGIRVHPVMTLTRNVNDHEVGAFIQLAVDNPALKNVVIQPAMYSGRYEQPRIQNRITLADTVRLICDQFGVFTAQDFGPIPCSDPNCFGMAVALRTSRGLLPVSRYFPRYENWDDDDAAQLIDNFSDTINGPEALSEAIRWITSDERIGKLLHALDDDEVDRLIDALAAAQSDEGSFWDLLLTISIKPFMDAWTYDQDRVDQCCVHILDEAGKPVSFCEFNAIRRPQRSVQEGNSESLPG
jgi:uncharacterized radical SAM superfamily Fe-S cluster-containing enzyme